MKQYRLGKTEIVVFDNGKFMIDNGNTEKILLTSHPNFEVNIDGGGLIDLGKSGFLLVDIKYNADALELKYLYEQMKLEVTVSLEAVSGVIVQKTTAHNLGNDAIRLTRLSSAYMDNIAHAQNTAWYEKDLQIYICHNKWQGEGQWRCYSPSELGVFPATRHDWESDVYKISSIGSWCTGDFYPLVIIEDKSEHKSWFMETEGAHSWQIKISGDGGYIKPVLALEATSADEDLGGWHYELQPGESYSAERAFYGMTDGGFEEVTDALDNFKRHDSQIEITTPPLVFNDYMDCVWGYQKPELILPLVDKAAEMGCEYFCIDGGWCTNRKGAGLGDWLPKEELYSETTLKDIADYIKQKGMLPGIWFEFDACSESSELYLKDEDCTIRRYGRAVGKGDRHFVNFKNEYVCNYLTERVRDFYDMGYRYIKNDYNQSTGIGCTNNYPGDSPAEGLIENSDAFNDFIDSLYEKFPDLLIENCGSGALRDDNKTLKRFCMQSTSDQEIYLNNPSIVMGSAAIMPPEKMGIWAYPYPTVLGEHQNFVPNEAYVKQREDGKETAFNIISGMMGALYLSGRIDLCDEKNSSLIKEGIDIYKDIRKYIAISRPVYPTGLHEINAKELASFGLLSNDRLMLAIWNTGTTDADVDIDLSSYITGGYHIGRAYSHKPPMFMLNSCRIQGSLEGESAVWLEIINE